jgi:hypothetical protein
MKQVAAGSVTKVRRWPAVLHADAPHVDAPHVETRCVRVLPGA